MGRKNFKGTVSIVNDRERIRLRWRYQGNRYSVNLNQYSKANLLKAKKLIIQIENDMLNERFDFSLSRYGKLDKEPEQKSIVNLFEQWTRDYRQMDCDKNTHYNALRGMLIKWEKITEQNALQKLNSETFSAKTYNERLTMLKSFCGWLVKAQIWPTNPFTDVCRKKVKKVNNSARKPFTEEEITKILNAIRYNTYCAKSD